MGDPNQSATPQTHYHTEIWIKHIIKDYLFHYNNTIYEYLKIQCTYDTIDNNSAEKHHIWLTPKEAPKMDGISRSLRV